jgi:hypothetical protein
VEVTGDSVAISTKNGSTPSSITVSPTAIVISGVSNIIGITSDNLSEGTTNRYNKPRTPLALTDDITINNPSNQGDLFVVPNTQVTPIEIELLDPSTSDYFYFTVLNKSNQAVTFSAGSNPIVDAYGFGSVTQGGLVTVLWDGDEWMISGGLDNKVQVKEIITTNTTLTAADSGKLLIISEDGITITMPANSDFNIDIAKMDESFHTLVYCAGTDKFREGTTTISVIRDVSITNSGIAGKEWLAIGAYEV